MLDHKKICFITCVNDEQTYEEALLYIQQLNIPEDYSIEALCIRNAKSLSKGYNDALKKSDAKYKVYMHQDVFIINKNFIKDFIYIFENHKTIGMLGVAGTKTIPSSGIWWESPYKYGKVYDSHSGIMELLDFDRVKNEYEKIKAIDGLIMITQYDIPWREEIFDGWHFYDMSQSLEFQKAGYEVAVPKQDTPWCIHDCGIVNMQNNYGKYRNIFLSEYAKELNTSVDYKTICFSCLTLYHVFVAHILSKTVYKNSYKMIIFSDHHLKKVYERSMELNLWDKVILIEEKNNPLHSVQQQLNQINLKNIDILHYFSWGSLLNCILPNYISSSAKIILTDEGIMTYGVKEFYENWKKINNIQYDPIDLNIISEIWLFDTRLYISEFNRPLKNIDFKTYLDNDLKFEFCKELNILFDYKYEKREWDILFFDQPLALANIIPENKEKSLLTNIIQSLKKFNLLIKKHPSNLDMKYTDLDVDVLPCGNIPWEVIYFNEYINRKSNMQNKIYMTYNSAAALNTRIFLKDFDTNNYFIILNKLLINFTDTPSLGKITERLFQKFGELYEKNFFEIESFEKLKNISDTLFCSFD